MSRYLEWRSRRLNAIKSNEELVKEAFPDRLYTTYTPNLPSTLPFEIGLLLPVQEIKNPVPPEVEIPKNVAAGIFLANPLLDINAWSRKLSGNPDFIDASKEGCAGWICNFPSVTQFESSYTNQLSDVGLGFGKEVELLKAFKTNDFKTLVSLGTPQEAEVAQKEGICDSLFVLPPISQYELGFPSVQQRSEQINSIQEALGEKGCPIAGLLQSTEEAFPSTWPRGMTYGIVQPTAPMNRSISE